MSARLRWDGLEDLKRMLRDLPEALTSEAGPIVTGRVERARDRLMAAYPEVRGNLRKGVRISRGSGGRYGQHYILKSSAPHAHLYERGTKLRATALGWKRGSMPGKPTFVPIVAQERRAMYGELADLLRAHGMRVTFDAA